MDDQDYIDRTLMHLCLDLSKLDFGVIGPSPQLTLSRNDRDLLLASLNTLMSQRNQVKVSNRYWSNNHEPGNAACGTGPGCVLTQAGGTQ